MAIDAIARLGLGLNVPAIGAFEIVPNDAVDLVQVTRQIRVAGGGDLAVVWFDGTETTIPVEDREVLDWRIVRVKATGTTATGLWGFY